MNRLYIHLNELKTTLIINENVRSIIGPILGFILGIGGVLTYIPQFRKIFKEGSVVGINELSLLIMNIGYMCLTMNSIIFNWNSFFCHNIKCYFNLFPFIQIAISWVMVLVYYIIYISFKFRNTNQRVISGLNYFITYMIFIVFVIALATGEKLENRNPSKFFFVFANILGYTSAICNGLVYIPQIYTLLKAQNNGSLSILTFALQAPGNLIIIIFQSIIYLQPVSTWIIYVITLIEQSIILILMIRFRNNLVYREIDDIEYITEN